MKKQKFICILSSVVLVLCLFVGNGSSLVKAESNVAGGDWSTGKTVTIDLKATPAPNTWIQLLADGVKVSAPGKICHDFRGGQYKWIADIRHLVGGKWVKVPTEQGWLNGKESSYIACAEAPAAGTYALFGYYAGPAESFSQVTCKYNMSGLSAHPMNDIESGFGIEVMVGNDVPAGTEASFDVIKTDPNYLDASHKTATAYYYSTDDYTSVYFSGVSVTGTSGTITIQFNLGNCSQTFDIPLTVD